MKPAFLRPTEWEDRMGGAEEGTGGPADAGRAREGQRVMLAGRLGAAATPDWSQNAGCTWYESRVSGQEACEGLRQASAWAVSEEDEEDEDGELQLASPPTGASV
jgi:hypothetical protein